MLAIPSCSFTRSLFALVLFVFVHPLLSGDYGALWLFTNNIWIWILIFLHFVNETAPKLQLQVFSLFFFSHQNQIFFLVLYAYWYLAYALHWAHLDILLSCSFVYKLCQALFFFVSFYFFWRHCCFFGQRVKFWTGPSETTNIWIVLQSYVILHARFVSLQG